jgi:hypothetical protein
LANPIEFDSLQQPVGLPSAGETAPDGTNVVASGWGYTSVSTVVMPMTMYYYSH